MQRLPADSRPAQALQAVLAYLWADEAANYEACTPREKRGHIFAELKTLQVWLSTPKKMLDKTYHTVARGCLRATRVAPEVVTPLALQTFTENLCAFAAEIRPWGRAVDVTTYVANSRGRR
jgi:hypothetical protein